MPSSSSGGGGGSGGDGGGGGGGGGGQAGNSDENQQQNTASNQHQGVWLRKHLNVWKARSQADSSGNSGAMRLKGFEKIISKSINKAKYRHPSKCKAEILSTVKIYRGLSPQFERFVFDNGDIAQLLNLNGTIPVEYKGSTYNIPVCIWMLTEFPQTAPMAFVVPTKDMQLKVSHHVDHTGKIFMTYITSWSHPESNLLGLIQACRDAFGELPPVFSKVSSQTQQHHQTLQEAHHAAPQELLQISRQQDHRVEDNHEVDHEHITLMNQVEEVLRERFTEEFYKTKAEVQTLHSTNKELLDGQEDIGALEAELDAKLSQVESCLEDLSLEQRGLVQSIKAIDNLDPEALDADKGIINTEEPLYGQIVKCFAEDAAIGDAIYHLGEGLRLGLIPSLDLYLKKVRNLSRQQFYLRATMIKARQKSGLDD